MKKISAFTYTGVVSLATTTLMAAPAFACHPQGSIIKEVQNVTSGSALSDANTASAAVGTAPSDTVQYTITVSNKGASAKNGDNDMNNVTLTDTLPAGVQLVSDPTQTTISENLGTIKPGASVTKTYSVKVTSTTNGDVITNKACFAGKSKDNKNNQSNCDVAVITVKVPPVTPPTTPTLPTTLPKTGSTGLTAGVVIATAAVLGYALNVLRLKRHADA